MITAEHLYRRSTLLTLPDQIHPLLPCGKCTGSSHPSTIGPAWSHVPEGFTECLQTSYRTSYSPRRIKWNPTLPVAAPATSERRRCRFELRYSASWLPKPVDQTRWRESFCTRASSAAHGPLLHRRVGEWPVRKAYKSGCLTKCFPCFSSREKHLCLSFGSEPSMHFPSRAFKASNAYLIRLGSPVDLLTASTHCASDAKRSKNFLFNEVE